MSAELGWRGQARPIGCSFEPSRKQLTDASRQSPAAPTLLTNSAREIAPVRQRKTLVSVRRKNIATVQRARRLPPPFAVNDNTSHLSWRRSTIRQQIDPRSYRRIDFALSRTNRRHHRRPPQPPPPPSTTTTTTISHRLSPRQQPSPQPTSLLVKSKVATAITTSVALVAANKIYYQLQPPPPATLP